MALEINRVAIVTGGGTGIGAATALSFAKEGTAVAVVGRRLAPLQETVARCVECGVEAMAIQADLGDAGTPSSIVRHVTSRWGQLDVLVNNAAMIKHLPIDEATFEVFNRHIAVNVAAPYFTIQAALPFLRASRSPAIVNISSSSGSLSIPAQSMYGTSKAALEYLTRSLAAELAPLGIRVNAIAPGPVDTPIHLSWAGDDIEGAYERMRNEVPLRRIGTAEELGLWIVWLASPAASFVTGAVIPVDGGQTLPGASSAIVIE